MTPEIDSAFSALKREYGAESIARVERMLNPRGQRRHDAQRDARWILPGISQRPWHDPHAYPELAEAIGSLQRNSARIKEEFNDAWNSRGGEFKSYQHYLGEIKDWKSLYLYRKGSLVVETAEFFPLTLSILRDQFVTPELICPLLESHFSILLPGARIAPHCDLWNFSINLHLAVDIPPGCALRVAGEERQWIEGKCLLFDYSFLHEAWNSGDRPRTCLLADLWHPEVTQVERGALSVLIAEIRGLLRE